MQQEVREAKSMAPVPPGSATGAPARFEETYVRFAPLLRKVAVKKYGIPVADAEPLVHDVFATYFTNADEVHAVERYLIGAICNAARHYRRRADAANALFCNETPCAATPTEEIVEEIARKRLLSQILARIGSRCRHILYRYYVHGETTHAIAESLRFKPATVLVLLSKCRKHALSAYRNLMESA